eukprot:jgi/Ulvmu1/12249/UM086_0040.1
MLIPRAFAILGATVLAVVLNEMLSWLLVYRTDRYTRLKQNLLQAEKRLETLKSNTVSTAKSKKKKETRTESQMKANMAELQKTRTVTMMVNGVLMLIFYQVLARGFKGVAVAKMPFEPLPLLRYFTHRGLPADSDPCDVSVSFVYLLCQVMLRTVVSKTFNFGIRSSLQKILVDPNNPLPGILPPTKVD